jgi:hypothetical protein
MLHQIANELSRLNFSEAIEFKHRIDQSAGDRPEVDRNIPA